VIARRQIGFALAVAVAGFQQLAGAVDAQPLDRVPRPAASVAVAREPPLGGEDPVPLERGDVALKISLVAEQPESALDLPFDVRPAPGRRLRLGHRSAPRRQRRGGQSNYAEMTHGRSPY
jgi:hypothetical protein